MAESTKGQFTNKEVDHAKKAVTLHRSLGFPCYQEFFRLLQRRYIIDCPVTVDDAKLALHIYGPSSAMKKEKTTSKKSSCITTEEQVKLPLSIKERHKNITLGLDFMYVNGIMFLHSISRKFKFQTVEVFFPETKTQGSRYFIEHQ